MKNIYYAHHLFKYDTKIEEYEINLIKKYLPDYKILNPNGDILHEDLTNEEKIMAKCIDKVSGAESLVFSSLSGVIGKGVYDEVNHAMNLGKEVYYIHDNKVEPCACIGFEIINESRRIYAIVKDITYYNI